ncbi:hypothetical protein [Sphaerisporangium sp. NPDC051011]|uniref:hypothetical protein n=1 Tax=Sphaerisporangium sp. NPDC051011 TaxID=3155792 RepID=UPI00340763BF
MLTDRDIVVKVLAKGKEPKACLAGSLARAEAVTIGFGENPIQEEPRSGTCRPGSFKEDLSVGC